MAGGGATLEEIKLSGRSKATIEFGRTLQVNPHPDPLPSRGEGTSGNLPNIPSPLRSGGKGQGEGPQKRKFLNNQDIQTAGKWLWECFRVPDYILGLPIGVHETDLFFHVLEEISGLPTPSKYEMERGRLIDSYVDAHKYVFQKRAIVYGEEDLVIGLASFLSEIGIIPVICASGGQSGRLKHCLSAVVPGLISEISVCDDADFMDMAEKAESMSPDLVIGNSKGYFLARKLGIPLVRVGFPIHDRIGGQRLLHLGYRGAQRLFDDITNTLLREKQDKSEVGYSYM
ncbi:MAG: hypothetical protein HY730_03165 [Candidatus Tectomicrobia bacterium]|uniref:Nitrogenase/oxidoreductase component 1 domain-containing protein n=1 Tax=Tectimicrobiota bacterium TaxID=2528274 RepID=A0A933GMB3_UNCTE|nr:hypothetical protein [Candidatus Tectomicrobia bacterium]